MQIIHKVGRRILQKRVYVQLHELHLVLVEVYAAHVELEVRGRLVYHQLVVRLVNQLDEAVLLLKLLLKLAAHRQQHERLQLLAARHVVAPVRNVLEYLTEDLLGV